MDAKLKHLEFIQAAIARMSTASFAFKGWAITIAGALFALAITNDDAAVIIVAGYSTALFWGLDGYYLWLERGFVDLYRRTAKIAPESIDFNMQIDKTRAFRRWLKTCVRPHLIMFYGIILFVEVLGAISIGKET